MKKLIIILIFVCTSAINLYSKTIWVKDHTSNVSSIASFVSLLNEGLLLTKYKDQIKIVNDTKELPLEKGDIVIKYFGNTTKTNPTNISYFYYIVCKIDENKKWEFIYTSTSMFTDDHITESIVKSRNEIEQLLILHF
ncbi:MAG: hypothetical protein NT007_08935 [Candidatus Kapabacteria bacterium]|nr:hypothetical protein [Candidatus Kapabacteria bacterium]